VGASDGGKRRVRRLALAALAWAACLFATGALIHVAAARRHSAPSVGASIRRERGHLPMTVPAGAASDSDAHLTHVVAVLAGVGAHVRCWSAADWARRAPDEPRGTWRAYTSGAPVLTVNLAPALCAELTRLRALRVPVWRDEFPDALALAVGALAHESMHVSGIRDEAKAECYGMQTIAKAAGLLGLSAAEGRYLAVLYARHWYPWWQRPYRSPDCRDGGRLDLHRATRVWP
jgi:hypothetical protein